MSRQLGELLLKERMITSTQLAEAAQSARSDQETVRYLIEKKYVNETKLLQYLSQKFGLPSINIAKFSVPANVLAMIPGDQAKKYQIIPVQSTKTALVVAIWDPSPHLMQQLEELKFTLKTNIEPVLTSLSAYEQSFQKYYGGSASFVASAAEAFRKEAKQAAASAPEGSPEGAGIELVEVHDIDSNSTENDAPIIALVNGVLSEAIRKAASDIHVEPYEKRFRVRMRIDGTLIEVAQIPPEMKRAVIARLKIMSRMDIAESRIPQDGRIKLKASGTEMDFRVNSMPTLFGEKVVLRLLNKNNLNLDLKKLGFETRQMEIFKKGIYAASGLVLVTGPTGSGKTTTLYSAIAELNQISDNISTAEDPVEYNLEGINQVQINKDVGLTFASVLRALLRQDPDIILVGEIRDYETAEIAVQASLTGHLVLSTLHTNDAPSTITRLMNMGLEPFLVVASVNVIVAQRLLRTICAKCKIEDSSVTKEQLAGLGFNAETVAQLRVFKGKGCETCVSTGYKGRVAIYEVLDFSNALKEMVLVGASGIELRKQAMKEGLKSLRMSALTKVAEGRTTLEEALSSTMED